MNLKTDADTETVKKTEEKENKQKLNEDVKQCERSLIIIKPDGVRRKAVGDIISRFEKAGLEIERIRVLEMDKTIAYTHYHDHEGKPYFDRLMNYMTSGPSIVMIIKGKDAIKKSRELMGPTDPAKAPKGTIRGDYGTDITINAIHGSDCLKSAEREINIFFGNYL
ncbi:MAG: nucleoside-diphosphate kinase [Actinobacteria bacterium]|nr:nucleoside-diphosphate kinase [Cyanobacteriota bacterium]MCL6088045.1 nucleoside-diphosphate kinase [Actinomycetota bacterium]